MTIDDLKPGMTCTILSQKKGRKYEGTVTIQQVNRDHIVTDAIRVQNQVVSFSGANNSLIFSENRSVPEVFLYINPVIIKDAAGKSVYQITLKKAKTVTVNRRKGTRLGIGREIVVRADRNERTYTCNLKDISAIGFAIVFTGKNIPTNYKYIKTFHFTYNDIDPSLSINVNFNLTGAVRRCVVLNEKQILFGCQIGYMRELDTYIKKKGAGKK